MSKENPISWADRLRQARKLAKSSARNFATHKTIGQKITAAGIAGGAAIGGVKRGRREWKRKDKKDRLSRTASGAAKGAFGGAITGAIAGHGIGRAIDYYRHESTDDLIAYLLNNPDCNISDVLTDSKFAMAKRMIDPRRHVGSAVLGAAWGVHGALKSQREHEKTTGVKADKKSRAKSILKGAVKGAVGGYAARVATTAGRMGRGRINRRISRWRRARASR